MGTKRKRVDWQLSRHRQSKTVVHLRDWAEFDQNLLELVLENLPVPDFISASEVCKPWRSVTLQHIRGKALSRVPWLLKRDPRNITRSCFNILQDVGYKIQLPACDPSYLRFIIGSFQHWLVMVTRLRGCWKSDICLQNPFSGAKVILPTMDELFKMAVLSAVPTEKNCVCMLRGDALHFWIHGAQEWLEFRSYVYAVDSIYHKGFFYLLDKDCKIVTIDVESVISTIRMVRGKRVDTNGIKISPLLSVRLTSPIIPITSTKFPASRWYIVKSSSQSCEDGKELLLVCKLYAQYADKWGAITGTKGFQVFQLDLSQMTASRLENLEDQTLFVGYCCSRSFSAKDLGDDMANSIYFINSVIDESEVTQHQDYRDYKDYDGDIDEWGVYCFENKLGSEGFFPFDSGHPKNFASIWIDAPVWWHLKATTSTSI